MIYSGYAPYRILLASQSPRRREILQNGGLGFRVLAIEADERLMPEWTVKEAAEEIALRKARAALPLAEPGEIVLGADTLVCRGEKIFGKPRHLAEAMEFLDELNDGMHSVITGVCLIQGEKIRVFHERTQVFFRKISKEERDYYAQNFKVLDKAGAYGIQDWIGWTGISRIEGCYLNVVGLPLPRILTELFAGEFSTF